jgi:hypothetical protein
VIKEDRMNQKNSTPTNPDQKNATEETSAGSLKSEQSSHPQNEHFEEVGSLTLGEKRVTVPLDSKEGIAPFFKHMTNTAFMERLMNFSPFGALVQPFVITGLGAYCEAILSKPCPTEPGNGLINEIAWWRIAADVKRQLDEQYGPEPTLEDCEDEGCPHYGTPHGHATP